MTVHPLWILGGIVLGLILLGWREYVHHQAVLAAIPLRIHVNGTRGKSSVTRLIAAGLRAGGWRTFAKVTGTAPRVIDNEGRDRVIHRLRGASIGEQVRMLKYFASQKAEAVVLECMAVQPQYQWISEQKMVRSHIGVLTNARPDHLDEMGPTLEDVTLSLANTIPFGAKFFTAEIEQAPVLQRIAEKRNSRFHLVTDTDMDPDIMRQFSYLEHPQNVALALDVCEAAGVPRDKALEGMVRVRPDLGSLQIWRLDLQGKQLWFVNGMAANDPVSTLAIWKMIINRYPIGGQTCIFLNTREDRQSRTFQLMELVYEDIQPDVFLIRGKNLASILKMFETVEYELHPRLFRDEDPPESIVTEMSTLPADSLIFAIGNQVGAGQEFLQLMQTYRADA
ncbi:MAG: poly-gamma-glutamate synthase PgsB [Candidatus Neomarinimicrobiota bacterium]|nr:MAG: poly-gamma-glutamate synthase PgsB [Candidatus Neomarinimicrobiota bacterium]